MTTVDKSYSELIKLSTLEERFEYLKCTSKIGERTFGGYRDLNQILYKKDPRWAEARRKVILRDNGNELGVDGFPISGPIYVHHINPITVSDVLEMRPKIFDPENLISTSGQVHRGLHYGDSRVIPRIPVPRTMYDTCPWKLNKL